ncbi:MAG: membrane protein insertion efficiency factor YidD [Roseivirga sp.]
MHPSPSHRFIPKAVPVSKWRAVRWLSFLCKQLFIVPILGYQYCIAPLIASCCRFQPSCSTYTKAAIAKYGVIKGIRLGMKRLARCHPWGGSGYDAVP